MAVVTLGDFTIGRGVFEPGWRWSNDVRPIAGTDSCQTHHTEHDRHRHQRSLPYPAPPSTELDMSVHARQVLSSDWAGQLGLAYPLTPVSSSTHGSAPSVHASCPGSRSTTSPGPIEI